jgi:AcrR family transcriptional regulator
MSSSPVEERSRVGRESATRNALMEATAQIMLEEGYAAASSRKVAARAGVKPALVHYYFPSMDDLFVAVLRAGAETNLQHQRDALANEEPLRTLWRLNHAHGSQLWMEFMALANHRKAIRSEIAFYAERFRDLEESAVTLALRAHGVDLASRGSWCSNRASGSPAATTTPKPSWSDIWTALSCEHTGHRDAARIGWTEVSSNTIT